MEKNGLRSSKNALYYALVLSKKTTSLKPHKVKVCKGGGFQNMTINALDHLVITHTRVSEKVDITVFSGLIFNTMH